MMFKMSGRQMVMFLTVVAPLMFLLAALVIEPSIWIVMLTIIWLGIGMMMLYIPREKD